MSKFAITISLVVAALVVAVASTVVLTARFNLTGKTLDVARVGGFASEISALRTNGSVISIQALKDIPEKWLQDAFVVKADCLMPPESSFGAVVVQDSFESGRVLCIARETGLGSSIASDGEMTKIKKSEIQRVVGETLVWRAWLVKQ